ncbi:hypothetical protein [Streptomyces sp. NPDC002535]
MSAYDDMTNADVLGAEDEARWAAEDTAATAQPVDDEPWDGLADGEER